MFIVIDGADGTGKSTAVRRLSDYLDFRNIDHITTREPGGSPLGDKLREVWVAPEYSFDGTTELLLMSAIRHHHVEETIKPALAAGKWVVCDRYVASTYALQGASGADPIDIDQVTRLATGGLTPDLTIILDVPTDVTCQRIRDRGQLDRIEQKGAVYHEKVREHFLEYAEDNPDNTVVVNGAQHPAMVHKEVLRHVQDFALDRTTFSLPPGKWEEFLELIDQPIEDNPKAMALLNSPRRWD